MPNPNRRTVIDETDAKAGSKEGVVRWVLLISITLTVIAFAIIVITGALSQGPVESQQNAERKVQAEREQSATQGSSIDGIVSDDPDASGTETSGTR